jgi:hypothetical protein
MKLIRLEAGKNDFALANLTLGGAMAIRDSLRRLKDVGGLSPVSEDVLCALQNEDLDNSDPFGEDHVGKVKARRG